MKQYYLWLLLDDLSLRTLPSQIQSNNWELTNLSYSFVFHFSQTIHCHQYGSCFWLGFLESIPFSYFFFKQLVAVKLNGGLHILCWSWVVRLRDSKKNVKISIITAVDWTCWLIISCNMTLFKLCHFGQKYCCGHHFICFALPHNLLRP